MNNPERFTEVSPQRKRGIWFTVAALAVFVVLLLIGFVYTMTKPKLLSEAALRANGVFLFERARDIGSFQLTDDNGQPFTPQALQGKWSLLFFGFTFCPDICPTTLVELGRFYQQLPPELAEDTQIMMVSVDPARDTVEKLHEYVRYFNPEFGGVTGEFLALHQFATSLNIPFAKVPGGGDNYQVEHSAKIAVINPRGHYVGFIKGPLDIARLQESYPSLRAARGG
jgi:protein SCO1/2